VRNGTQPGKGAEEGPALARLKGSKDKSGHTLSEIENRDTGDGGRTAQDETEIIGKDVGASKDRKEEGTGTLLKPLFTKRNAEQKRETAVRSRK
jgi:hypothetical protein